MALTTYTITKADGTKQVKEIEYTPLTMEEIYAKAAELADGETSGTKFEDRLYTVAVEEGQKKAKFDYVAGNQDAFGADSNVTESDMSALLKAQEQSNAAALNRDKIAIATDDKLASDKINNKATAANGLSAWEWEKFYNEKENRRNILQNIDNSLTTGTPFSALTSGQPPTGGTNTGMQLMSGNNLEDDIGGGDGGGNPTIGTGDATLNAMDLALRDVAPYDVFSQYLAMSPYVNIGALRRAAAAQYNPLSTEFILRGAMPQTAVEGTNPFAAFLGEGRVTSPEGYAALIRRAGDITGMSADEWNAVNNPYLQDKRGLALRDLFTGTNQGQYELAAANLPFQQSVGSPIARQAISNTIQNMYDRFRAQYPIQTGTGDPSSFLNFIRARNLGGMFGTEADKALQSQFFTGTGNYVQSPNVFNMA